MATNTSTNSSPEQNLQTGSSSDALFKSIQDKLFEQSGIISSTNSNLQTRLDSAISGIKESATSSNAAIESQFGRELGYTEQAAADSLASGRAAQSGGVMNMAALRALTETTDKSLKDLEQRKQELILQNNAQAASKISELQLKSLEFQQQAQQQAFSNLLGMSNIAMSAKQEERMARQQSFTEKQAVSNVALQYGIAVKEGDTLESVVARAAPFASKQQAAELARTLADTRRIEADIQRIKREGVDSDNFDVDSIALAAERMPEVLGTIKDTDLLAKVINKRDTNIKKSISDQIMANISKGEYKTKSLAIRDIQSSAANGTIDPSYLSYALEIIDKNYKEPEKNNNIRGQRVSLYETKKGTTRGGLIEPVSLSDIIRFSQVQ